MNRPFGNSAEAIFHSMRHPLLQSDGLEISLIQAR